MAIDQGENGNASDFINESERNGTPANDDGRVAKLESDGYLSRSFLRVTAARIKRSSNYQLPATGADYAISWDSEDFDTASLHDNTAEATVYSETTRNGEETAGATTDWFGQAITISSGQRNVVRGSVWLRHTLDSSNSIEVVLRSSLTGADLATTGTLTFNPSGTSESELYFTIPDYVISTPGTYYVVVKTSTYPGAGTFNCRKNTSGSGGWRSDDSGASWTSVTGGYAMSIYTDNRRYIKAPAAGYYLALVNLNSGVGVDKTIKLKKNNSTMMTWLADSDGTVEASLNYSTILSLSADDIVYPTINQASSASDDVLSDGSSFELFRL